MRSKRLVEESQVNWVLMKQLYIQGAQRFSSPEPVFERRGENFTMKEILEELEEHFKQLLVEINHNNQGLLDYLETQFRAQSIQMQERIAKLQEQVASLKRKSKREYKSFEEPKIRQRDTQQIEDYNPELKQTASFIHIEEDGQQSLLDGIPEDNEMTVQKVQKQRMSAASLQTAPTGRKPHDYKPSLFGDMSKNLFHNKQSKESLRDSRSTYKNVHLATKSSSVFDLTARQLKEEVGSLRKFIELAHGIKMSDYLSIINNYQSPREPVKKIEMQYTKQPEMHLMKENQALRNQINLYRRELEETKQELIKIKYLLYDCQHEYQNNLMDL